jgi:hypothetical protein
MLAALAAFSLLPTCSARSCPGTFVANRSVFRVPVPYDGSSAWNWSNIKTNLPITTSTGYTLDSGPLGWEQFARLDLRTDQDDAGKPWRDGQVNIDDFALPNATTGGYKVRTTSLHENFNNGLDPSKLLVLMQKGSLPENVDVVTDIVDGKEQNVLRLKAQADPGTGVVGSGAIMQTTDMFASGRFEIKAKFPKVEGLVFAVWTFHYEKHLDSSHLPPGSQDGQYVPHATGYIARVNHEIDFEVHRRERERERGGRGRGGERMDAGGAKINDTCTSKCYHS